MSELICPNCGKENPPESEFCEQCQLPLINAGNSEDPGKKDSPDWLQRIRERSQVEKTEKPPLGEFGAAEDRPFDHSVPPGEIPDWLQEIQKLEIPQKKEEPPAEDIDWITKLHEIKGETDRSFSQSTTFYSDEELAAMAAAARKREADAAEESNLPVEVDHTDLQSNLPAEKFNQPLDLEHNETTAPENLSINEAHPNNFNESFADLTPLIEDTSLSQSESSSKGYAGGDEPTMEDASFSDIPQQFDGKNKSIPIIEETEDSKSETDSSQAMPHDAPKPDSNSVDEKLIPEDVIQPQYNRAPEYSGRLDISESQRDSITLLKSMLVGEIQPKTPLPTPGKFSGRLMRAVLGVFLLIVMGYPFLTGFNLVSSQALFAPGVVGMHNTITSLPENAPFLVVTDFEPAFSGEMRSASIGIIDNLMMKNMDFTIISTLPAGPALARDLFSKTRPTSLAYPAEKLAILGFIPGGTTGLQEFIRNPRRTAPLLDNGSFAWTYSAAQSVNSIQDYSGVLVITENAEIGRAWVEQLQGQLDGRPLLMVGSAQSAPIIRPYLDSGQLKGLVNGRVEGAMYDRLMAAPPRAASETSAYQMGMVLAALLIIVGGIYGLLKKFILRQPVGTSEDWHGG